MARGTVVRIVTGRGFGFLKGEDGGEVFFHHTVVRGGLDFDSLVAGQAVEYEAQLDPQGRGERAIVVKRAPGAPVVTSGSGAPASTASGGARAASDAAQSTINRVAALLEDPALSPPQRAALAEGVARAARLLRDVLLRAAPEPARAERGEARHASDSRPPREAAKPAETHSAQEPNGAKVLTAVEEKLITEPGSPADTVGD